MGKVIALSLILALVGCTTTKGSFCTVAKAIRPSKETIEKLTDAEVAAILAHNRKLQKLCRVQP